MTQPLSDTLHHYNAADVAAQWLEKRYGISHYRAKVLYDGLEGLHRPFTDMDVRAILAVLEDDDG